MSWLQKKVINPLSRAVRKLKLKDIIDFVPGLPKDELLQLKAIVDAAVEKLRSEDAKP